MKFSVFIFFLLSLSACALFNNPHYPHSVPLKFKSGDTYNEVLTRWGSPEKCVVYLDRKYCEWNGWMMRFKNDILESSKELDYKLEYSVAVLSLTDGSSFKKVFLRPGSEFINPDGLEWRQVKNNFKAVLLKNGFTLVDRPEDSELIVNVTFGLSGKVSNVSLSVATGGIAPLTRNSNTVSSVRFLSMVALHTKEYLKNKKSIEAWKVTATSIGKNSDILHVVPALALCTVGYIGKVSAGVEDLIVHETSLDLDAFKDYVSLLN